MKKRVMVSIDQEQYDFLKEHPEINLSGMVRKSIAQLMPKSAENKSKGSDRTDNTMMQTSNRNRGSKLIVCPYCSEEWEYKGKRSYIQCINCNKRIRVTG